MLLLSHIDLKIMKNNNLDGDEDNKNPIGQIIQSISNPDPSISDYKVISNDGRTITLKEQTGDNSQT